MAQSEEALPPADGAAQDESAAAPAEPAETAPPSDEAAAQTPSEPVPYDSTIPVAEAAALAEPGSPQEDAQVQLDDVVVTATKREASSRDLAGTVNVLSGEQLESMGAREMQDYLKLIPGLTLQEGETDSNRTISIRGIGPQPNANVTTGILIENVSMTDPFRSFLVPDLDPFDLRDLEVLKGPQGTLFGANALNGAIRYVLNKPQFGVWETKGFVNWVDVNQGEATPTYGGAVNVPLSDYAGLRLVGIKQRLPGLYDDVNANGKNEIDADYGDKEMYRIVGAWQPTGELSINAFYIKQDSYRNDLSVANNLDGDFVRTNTPGPSTSQQKFDVANLDVKYDLGWSSLVSETSFANKFSDINYDGSSIVPSLAEQGVESLRLHAKLDNTKVFAQELRLVSPGEGPWNWIGGVYFYRYEGHFMLNAPVANTEFLADVVNALGLLGLPTDDLESLLVPTSDGLSLQNVRIDPIKAREESVFGELSRKFFDDDLEVTLGGRLYQEKMVGDTQVDGVLGPYGDAIGYTGPREIKARGFNPKLSAKYQWSREFMVYSTVARGFQFGGFNVPAPLPSDNVYSLTYDPSNIWSYELGVRSAWFQNTLQFDLTGFWIDWTDMQLIQDTPSGNTDYTDNVSRARSKGLEGSMRWLTPVPGVILSAAAAYVEATVEETYTTANGVEIPPGTELPSSPHLKTTTALGYTTYLGSLKLGATLSYSQTGKAYSNIEHELEIFDYGTFDAGVTLGWQGSRFAPELSIGINNFTDETGLLGARHIGPDNAQEGVASFVRPRTLMARLSAGF